MPMLRFCELVCSPGVPHGADGERATSPNTKKLGHHVYILDPLRVAPAVAVGTTERLSLAVSPEQLRRVEATPHSAADFASFSEGG